MRSAVYVGKVAHARFVPKQHKFNYGVYMLYLDLEELDEVVGMSKLVSKSRWSALQFKRSDFHGDPKHSIKSELIKTVKKKTGIKLDGPVAMLANWRCFGLNFNPLVVYYCFDSSGENLQAIVAEVTNTPWFERHAYVMKVGVEEKGKHCVEMDKVFTVSPFNPLNMKYVWDSSMPEDNLQVGIKNYQGESLVFHASLKLIRTELNRKNIRKLVLSFPFMTLKVVLAIYWEAAKLAIKGVPFLGKDKTTTVAKHVKS